MARFGYSTGLSSNERRTIHYEVFHIPVDIELPKRRISLSKDYHENGLDDTHVIM